MECVLGEAKILVMQFHWHIPHQYMQVEDLLVSKVRTGHRFSHLGLF